ncbi:hypothetical protein CKN73_05645 [Carnobacterium divergens]|uniref:helix-turn-helix domain-containing protein n=1 Tax=Carnobacterium divergens TaxID=2748 RepID=UPI001071B4F6|nr:helix-turn-helix domain-containing protein [Carnobacterium divergens]TFJ41168.1 hypothetical protein CKN77_05770 [Carnobacterium divergens]TFJ49807.1 hypothetical protein CKN73_05645 [Carnobacterium divergens]TFJ55092.1 hypothetical protein CKN83_05575 [Carnobacterium divergens]TFJ61658.1 hypothetical protein CKN89_05880 [Carnobacterium divergens]TFJ71380.1 hypothetical protein CKN91_05580 [Carnobacterium divergens]
MLNFLNDEYVRSIKALYFISSSPNPVSIDEIALHIGSVRRTVVTLLTLIKTDSLSCNFQLQETTEKKYYLVSKIEGKAICLDDYLLIGAKRSLLFLMTEELFNKGAINTIQFCNDHYISQITFSRGKKKLSELLERSQLRLTNYVSEGIVGNEYQIRIFYFHFFNSFYHSIEEPFKSIEGVELLNQELAEIFGEMTDYQKRKLHYLLYVMKKRTKQRHTVEPLPISFDYITKYDAIYRFIGNYLSVHGVFDPQLVKNETHFFICSIYTQDIISLKTNYLKYLLEYAKDNSLHVEISNIWIDTFKKLGAQVVSSEEELAMQEELGKFHLAVDFLYCDPSLFIVGELNLNTAKMNPEIYDYTLKFYRLLLENESYATFRKINLKNITDEYLVKNYYYYLYYSFLKRKKPNPILLYIADSIERIDRRILIGKLTLLFGAKITIVDNNYSRKALMLTNIDTNEQNTEEIVIFSYNDEQNLKKVIDRIHQKIYEQLLD